MKMIFDALFYPLKGSGWIMILLGTILSLIFHIGSYAPFLGIPVAFFGGGYFTAFFFEIITSTVNRESDCADWPSISSPWELLSPILRLNGALLVSALPALAYLWLHQNVSKPGPELLAWVGVGCFYFPMAILGIIQFGGLSGVLPHLVLPAIFRCLPGYLFAMVALALVSVLPICAEEWAKGIRYWHWVIIPALSLYSLMAQARFIGLLYLKYEDRIGWD